MGYIYILTNPAYPGYSKIGYTSMDVFERAKGMSKVSGILYDFEVYAYYQTDAKLNNKEVCGIFEDLLPNLNGKERRGFFKEDPRKFFDVLLMVSKLDGRRGSLVFVGNDQEPVQGPKKSRFSFGDADIPVGSEIEFVDNSDIKATVKDNRNILFEGKTTSLSKLAQELLGIDHPVQGTLYFKYNGEILNDRRNRMEAEGSYGAQYEQPREIQ